MIVTPKNLPMLFLAMERAGGWGRAALLIRIVVKCWRFIVSKPKYTLAS